MTVAVSKAVGTRSQSGGLRIHRQHLKPPRLHTPQGQAFNCAVLLPSGKIATGKLAQAFVHGARVIALEGNFDRCLTLIRELSTEPGIAVVNSINHDRLEGRKRRRLK